MKKLINDCWLKDPEKRPSFDEIVERLLGDVKAEVMIEEEPVYTCDFEHPENNDEDYDKPGKNGMEDVENNHDGEIVRLRARLATIESVEKKNEQLEKELPETKKFEVVIEKKTPRKETAREEEKQGTALPDFMKGIMADR